MLEVRNISLDVGTEEEPVRLLSEVSFRVPQGHFMAIVGPSGCGKTTLLKAIAGIREVTDGSFIWGGRDLEEDGDFEPHEIGYVPQFSIAHEELCVFECVENAAVMRVKAARDECRGIAERVLEETGLSELGNRPVRLLSGGQRRRLALAMELVSDPRILLCDEVTSGLDPQSESEIVQLLCELSRRENRIVLSVTHSLSDLEKYDSVLVMVRGYTAYHGTPSALGHYFGVESPGEVYARLALREPEAWAESWGKHGEEYYRRMGVEIPVAPAEKTEDDESEPEEMTPGFFAQFSMLLKRRLLLLFRDRSQLLLQVAMILIFPILVAVFSGKGQEQLMILSDIQGNDLALEIQAQQEQAEVRARVGSAISGIVMFQVILLGLMGANNASREIAGERAITEKEKFAGMRVGAYIASKYAYLCLPVLVQSLWMFAFVQGFWPFRGDAVNHFLFLLAANAAMTSVCLGISANCRTADQASLLSIYLVGFQLPLSGAVLALPDTLETVVQPFISAYWAWSGSLDGGLQADVMKAVCSIVQTTFSPAGACMAVLLLHVAAGVLLTVIGMRRSRWE